MLFILAGIVLLYLGAEGLVRGSSALAIRAGIHPLIVGLTVVAFGTSAPELTVSVSASLKGLGEVAVGNVIGSNIFNVAVILGIAALIRPPAVHLDLLRRDIPIMVVVSLAGFGLIVGNAVSRPAGIGLVLGLVVYLVFTVRSAKREPAAAVDEVVGEAVRTRSIGLELLMVVAGLGLLVWGSSLFVSGAITVARGIGVSEAVIALTIVAAGTSLPELATSVVAAIKGQADIAVGNVVGSNIFNILCILGVTGAMGPVETGEIGLRDGGVMLALSVVLLPLAMTGRSISRWEGGFLLLCYGGYLVWLWPG